MSDGTGMPGGTGSDGASGHRLPVAVVGAGPVGLTAALGLRRYGVPVVVFEEDEDLSRDTKAGTLLSRTLEVFHRYGVDADVLEKSLRLDEIGEVDRATNVAKEGVHTSILTEDTRFPFVINLPQHHLEPLLRRRLEEAAPGALRMQHRLVGFTDRDDHVELVLDTPNGLKTVQVSHLVACDGGRSLVRTELGIPVEGETLEERYMLVDILADLDSENPRDYPYLSYFGDPQEWMILVRQPHCWRFLYPLASGAPEPTSEELLDKAQRFLGEVDRIEVLGTNVYTVHHRVARQWRVGRTFLMGDAAHLITPMWALGLNTGVLDASNLPWRLAWVLRGWADDRLLDGYEAEQAPVAILGAGQMAEAARQNMARTAGEMDVMKSGTWGVAITRTLLGVSLDVDGSGDWSMVRTGDTPGTVRQGDRAPDLPLFGARGAVHLHDLTADSLTALYFTDTRRGPRIPSSQGPALSHYLVSRWDAPLDSPLRAQFLFDPGDRLRQRFAPEGDALVLLRPDGHVAAIRPYDPASGRDIAEEIYQQVVGRPSSHATTTKPLGAPGGSTTEKQS